MNTSDVYAQKWAVIPDFAIPLKLEVQVILSNRSSVKKVRNELSINDGLKVCVIFATKGLEIKEQKHLGIIILLPN